MLRRHLKQIGIFTNWLTFHKLHKLAHYCTFVNQILRQSHSNMQGSFRDFTILQVERESKQSLIGQCRHNSKVNVSFHRGRWHASCICQNWSETNMRSGIKYHFEFVTVSPPYSSTVKLDTKSFFQKHVNNFSYLKYTAELHVYPHHYLLIDCMSSLNDFGGISVPIAE